MPKGKPCYTRLLVVFLLLTFSATGIFAQPERIAAGLSFTTAKRFNQGKTGNPGLSVKLYVPVDKRKNLHVIPSITAFNPMDISQNSHIVRTFRYHGELDVQYKVFHEKTLKVIAFVGANFTYIDSRITPLISVPNIPADSSMWGWGPAIGAGLEMRMGPMWDFIVSGRYTFSGVNLGEGLINAPISTPIIQVQGVYYFVSRGRGYSRR